LVFGTEKIATRGTSSHRRRYAPRWYIMEYLEMSNIFRRSLVNLLLKHRPSLRRLRYNIFSGFESSSRGTVFGWECIWSWSRIWSHISTRKSFWWHQNWILI
jgi:hypothetical protein